MRPARVASPALVAVAHGSKDPRAAVTVTSLLDLARSRAAARGTGAVDARAAFLDHCAPSLADALDGVGEAVLVPLLLTAAYHSKSDIPAQVAALCDAAAKDRRGPRLHRAATLGPHPLLLAGLERRLREALAAVASPASPAPAGVVLAAAGSSDPQANATIADLAAQWQATGRWQRVVPGYASAAAPSVAEAVRALHGKGHETVVVATYLLAPGYFAGKIAAQARGAGALAVSEPLGAIPEVADVILARYAQCLPGGLRPRFDPPVTRPRLAGGFHPAEPESPPGCGGRAARPSRPCAHRPASVSSLAALTAAHGDKILAEVLARPTARDGNQRATAGN